MTSEETLGLVAEVVAAARVAPGSDRRRIIVTMGTSRIVQVATLTADAIAKLKVVPTVVFTGSFRPAAFLRSDAPFNLGAAFAAVQVAPGGVLIALSGRVLHPRDALLTETGRVSVGETKGEGGSESEAEAELVRGPAGGATTATGDSSSGKKKKGGGKGVKGGRGKKK
jgi:L-asparaginase/Glu-tRNA(Gln) amidotransferase subunit D